MAILDVCKNEMLKAFNDIDGTYDIEIKLLDGDYANIDQNKLIAFEINSLISDGEIQQNSTDVEFTNIPAGTELRGLKLYLKDGVTETLLLEYWFDTVYQFTTLGKAKISGLIIRLI